MLLRIMAGALALVVFVMVLWGVALYASHGSLSLGWGVLPKAKAEFLDGSGRVFQRTWWHWGNAARTWGEIYGVKIHRCCLSAQVTHLNPRITPAEAREHM